MNKLRSYVNYYLIALIVLTAIAINPCQAHASGKNSTIHGKFEPDDGKIYHGVCLNPESDKFAVNMADYIKIAGRRPVVITFFANVWSKGKYSDWKYFGRLMKKVDDAGAIPFVKATTADWDKRTGLWWSADDILAGMHDDYFIQAADVAKDFGKPMFLSWNHEMNGNWYPWSEAYARKYPGKSDWTADKYIKVWQHIVTIYRKRGANNVAFAWAPDVSGQKIGSYNANESWRAYWPGNDYVDWIAPSLYNKIDPIQLDSLAEANKGKPIFISEWGTSVNDQNWYRPFYPGDAAWFKRFFELMLNRYPNVKGMSYFQWEPAYYIQRNADQIYIYRDFMQNYRFINGPLPIPK